MCLRKETTEPKWRILVSFFSEVTSYFDTNYCIHRLLEMCRSVPFFKGHPVYMYSNLTHVCKAFLYKIKLQLFFFLTIMGFHLHGDNCDTFIYKITFLVVIGVRDEFQSGAGAEVSCPNIFFQCWHENQVALPNITWFFLPDNGYLKILGVLHPPSAPWAVRQC